MAFGRICALSLTGCLVLGTLASCTSTANVSDVYTALDANGDRKRNVFFTDSKEIHCVVEMGIGRRGATLEVIIRQLYTYDFVVNKFFETDRVLANAETTPSPQTGLQKVDVQLKPLTPDTLDDAEGGPFPQGRYQCEAYLDGHLEQVAIFNILFPPCPTSFIKPAAACYGYYPKGQECPKYGLTSRDPVQCRCSDIAGWECPP